MAVVESFHPAVILRGELLGSAQEHRPQRPTECSDPTLRRDERVTVQGPVKEQPPDGMAYTPPPPPPLRSHCAPSQGPQWRRRAGRGGSGEGGGGEGPGSASAATAAGVWGAGGSSGERAPRAIEAQQLHRLPDLRLTQCLAGLWRPLCCGAHSLSAAHVRGVRGGLVWHLGGCWSAAGGAHWPIATHCPSLGPSPSVGGGASRPLTHPSSPSVACLSLSTAVPFPLGGRANGAPGPRKYYKGRAPQEEEGGVTRYPPWTPPPPPGPPHSGRRGGTRTAKHCLRDKNNHGTEMAMKVVRQARLEHSGGSTPDLLRPRTKVTIAGKNEIYRWEIGPSRQFCREITAARGFFATPLWSQRHTVSTGRGVARHEWKGLLPWRRVGCSSSTRQSHTSSISLSIWRASSPADGLGDGERWGR